MSLEAFVNQFPLTEFLYSCAVIFASLLIYLKTKRTAKFARHKGMRYLSNTFLFLALAFIVRFVFFSAQHYPHSTYAQVFLYQGLILIPIEFLFMLSSLSLFLSLHYKQLGGYEHGVKYASLFFILVLAIVDYAWKEYLLMYIAASAFFLFAALKSYHNHKKSNNKVSQVFFIATALLFIAWALNFVTQYSLDLVPVLRWYVYTINLVAVGIITAIVFASLKEF